jgi:lipoic acid synthetase
MPAATLFGQDRARPLQYKQETRTVMRNETRSASTCGGHSRRRLPPWLKRPLPTTSMLDTRKLINGLRLHTVCVEARCPNVTECWSRGTATFMILGDVCTRRCHFCAVDTGRPLPPEDDEPQRLAEAAVQLALRHVVITSVARDDLPDEGAEQFARCIAAVRAKLPDATIEVLVPDFHARRGPVGVVCDARPEVYNHNLETVAGQQKRVRPAARYRRSLDALRIARELGPALSTKSGIMVGLGETKSELVQALKDLRAVGCDLLTIGQYLQPGPQQVPVARYYPPEDFEELATVARDLGFAGVASGPFVRSSYFAETLLAETHASGTRPAGSPPNRSS